MENRQSLSRFYALVLIISIISTATITMVPVLAAFSPYSCDRIYLDPAAVTYDTEANLSCTTDFDVMLKIENVENLKGFEWKLWYNTTLLDGYTSEADIQVSYSFVAPTYPNGTWHCNYDNQGLIYGGVTLPTFITGDYDLIEFHFHITYAPPRGYYPPDELCVSCPLTLNETELVDSGGLIMDPASYDEESGYYEYCRPQIIAGEPVASFIWSPTYPYVSDEVTCTSTSTPNGGDLIAWLWEIVGAATNTTAMDEPVMKFHCDGAGIVDVTLTVWDDEDMNDTVTHHIEQSEAAGCILDVYTSNNRFCGQTTDFVGKGLGENCDALSPDVNVTLFAKVSWNGAPVMHVLVAFEVIWEWAIDWQDDPWDQEWTFMNDTVLIRTAETDKDGIARIWFRVPNPCTGAMFGKWFVRVTAKVQENKQEDIMRFDVGHIITINWVETDETTYYKYDEMAVRFYYKNIAWMPKHVTFVVSVYDDCDVPIAHEVHQLVAEPGVYCHPNRQWDEFVGIEIPQWTYVGTGKVYVSAYTALPGECGTPYCPEKSTQVLLKYQP